MNNNFINSKWCFSLTWTLPPSTDDPPSGINISALSCFGDGGYFIQRRHYSGSPTPFSPINYSDVTELHYAWKCSQLSISRGSCCVRPCACWCVCVNITVHNLIVCETKGVCVCVNLLWWGPILCCWIESRRASAAFSLRSGGTGKLANTCHAYFILCEKRWLARLWQSGFIFAFLHFFFFYRPSKIACSPFW